MNKAFDNDKCLGTGGLPEAQRNSLTIDELAHRWSCSHQTVRRRIKDGKIRSFRIGWRHLVPLAEIERIEMGEHA